MAMSSRPDLAAMLVPIGRRLMALEQPILDAAGLSMWGYSVLLALGDEPVRTQAALAEMIGADKTRIIADLDELQDGGMITREPDPADRRVRLVAITAKGRRTRDRAQSEIQKAEERLLSKLSRDDRAAFLRAAQTLSEVIRDGDR
jgi:DNA-binding MarR family transcriptional regulator